MLLLWQPSHCIVMCVSAVVRDPGYVRTCDCICDRIFCENLHIAYFSVFKIAYVEIMQHMQFAIWFVLTLYVFCTQETMSETLEGFINLDEASKAVFISQASHGFVSDSWAFLCSTVSGWYCSMKSKMEKRAHLAAISVNEHKMFHGTPDLETEQCICHQNFDHRNMEHCMVKAFIFQLLPHTATNIQNLHKPVTGSCSWLAFCWACQYLARRSTGVLRQWIHYDHMVYCMTVVWTLRQTQVFLLSLITQCYPEFLTEYEVFRHLPVTQIRQATCCRPMGVTPVVGPMAVAYTSLQPSSATARSKSQRSIHSTNVSATSYVKPVSAAKAQGKSANIMHSYYISTHEHISLFVSKWCFRNNGTFSKRAYGC